MNFNNYLREEYVKEKITKSSWVTPEIEELGEAKDLIKNLTPLADSKNDPTPADFHALSVVS